MTAIIVLFLLLILPDSYIYRTIVKKQTKRKSLRLLHWLPSALLFAILIYILSTNRFTRLGMNWVGDYFFILILLTVPKLLFTILSLIGTIFKRFLPLLSTLFHWAGILLALLSIIVLLYGRLEGYRHYQVNEVVFGSPNLPQAFDGYRIIQFSDLHIGSNKGNGKEVSRLVDLMNAQQGDIIVFTGDAVNHKFDELLPYTHILSKLSAPDGVYSILGNHDYSIYHQWDTPADSSANIDNLIQCERGMGWDLLLDECRLLQRGDTSIALIGIENYGRPPFPQLGNLERAKEGSGNRFKVLLSHDPTFWNDHIVGADKEIALTLSGHTHGLQFAIGSFTPVQWIYPQAMGMYSKGGQNLYVNVGCGSLLFPFRFGAWPEVTVITLKRSANP